MSRSRATRGSETPRGDFTKLVDNVVYAVTATLVVCCLSFAAQRMFLEPATTSNERGVVQTIPSLKPGAVAASNQDADEAIDWQGSLVARGPQRRLAAAGRDRGVRPDAGTPSHPTDAVAAHGGQGVDSGSWSLMSSVANLLSFGGASAAGGSRPAVSDTPRPASFASVPSSGAKLVDIFFGTDEGTACQPGDREFVLTDVGNLYVCVLWRGLSGKYAEELTFVLPDGNVYQTMPVPFMTNDVPPTTDPTVDVGGRRLPATRAGWGANGASLVTAALPVSGTYITQYSLAGLWTVQVSLDGRRVGQDNFEFFKN
jgi:hypothetical protein